MVTFRINKCTFKTTYTVVTKKKTGYLSATFESLNEALIYKQKQELKYFS